MKHEITRSVFISLSYFSFRVIYNKMKTRAKSPGPADRGIQESHEVTFRVKILE